MRIISKQSECVDKMYLDQIRATERTPSEEFTCSTCDSPLIQPLEWIRLDEDQWTISVYCPECFQVSHIYCNTDQAHLFHNMLDEATRELAEAADMLDRQIFRESCDSFKQALQKDLITPLDFC